MQAHQHSLHNGQLAALRDIVAGVADVARTMHAAGLHHQDFYLTHLMVPQRGPAATIHVLDLGRVRFQPRLARRWIVKDLAQLNYSAAGVSASDRLRFLTRYLGHRPTRDDRPLVTRIVSPIPRHRPPHPKKRPVTAPINGTHDTTEPGASAPGEFPSGPKRELE